MSLLLSCVQSPDEEVLSCPCCVVYKGQIRRCYIMSLLLCSVQRPDEEVMGHFLFVLCKEAR